MKNIRNYFISGLLVWIPLGLTVLLVKFFIDLADGMIPIIYQSEALIGVNIPGIGIIFIVLVIFFTGLITTNFIGRRLLELWNNFLGRIPGIRNIYNAIKQISDTVLTSSTSFEKVLLIEYPRKGLWTIAFKTGNYRGEVEQYVGKPIINIYVPTTPNPTSGFFLMLAEEEVTELNMSIDDALKLIISGGIVSPKIPVQKKE